MKLKKVAALATMVVALFAAAACGNSAPASDSGKSTAPVSEKAPAKAKKVLVVYYSDTGRTEQVAKAVASVTKGDLLKLVPEQPYTAADLDYNNKSSRVTKEHDTAKLQDEVKLTNGKPANWAEYDTVFVGYPIWWGIAAWPVNQFFTGNDFTGKTVIPFATAYSSGLGKSADLVKEKAGGKGTWVQGKCFTGSIDDKAVTNWVGSLGVQ